MGKRKVDDQARAVGQRLGKRCPPGSNDQNNESGMGVARHHRVSRIDTAANPCGAFSQLTSANEGSRPNPSGCFDDPILPRFTQPPCQPEAAILIQLRRKFHLCFPRCASRNLRTAARLVHPTPFHQGWINHSISSTAFGWPNHATRPSGHVLRESLCWLLVLADYSRSLGRPGRGPLSVKYPFRC